MKIVVKQANSKNNGNLPPSERQWYYNEVADNGEIVSVSEMYVNRANAARAAFAKAGLYESDVPVQFEESNDDD